MAVDKPIKVAVIGGGCASIAAAFELTRPEHKLPNGRPKYDVTVYQMGWRLGGKAASGRGPNGRIEEHGLHVWLGFYENAFRLMRACYQELTNDPHSWRKHFFPDSHIGVAGDSPQNGWEAWTAYFPPTEGLPGDPLDDQNNPFTLGSYLARAVTLLRALLLSVHTDLGSRRKHGKGKRSSTDAALDAGRLEFSSASPRLLVGKMAQMLRVGVLSTAAGLLQAMLILEVALRHRVTLPGSDYTILEFIEAVATNTRRQLEDVVAIDPQLRKRTEIIELVLAILVGAVRDRLLTNPHGLDAINGIDCRDWLLKHGATRSAVDSAFVRGLYNMAFADQAIAGKKRGLAAGQALRGALRMFFTYRGALFWRMRGSMGDVVFVPFYQVLKKRRVKFEFFHRLENVKVVDSAKLAKDEPPYVEALQFDVQAKTKQGGEYDPLIRLDDSLCWPSEPRYELLEKAATLKKDQRDFESHWDRRRVETRTLRVGRDFDFVVLGVSIGAIRHVCSDLIKQSPRWAAMVRNVKTVATQAFQVWMRKDMAQLGWSQPAVTLTALGNAFDTWSDMTHMIPAEQWPAAATPRSLAYFCGVLPDDGSERPRPPPGAFDAAVLQEQRDKVGANAIAFLNDKATRLWPNAKGPNSFDWTLLVDSSNPKTRYTDAKAAIKSQYCAANVNPTDRYVLSLPGSLAHRISPLDTRYDNLTIAGDWTDCGFNEGCVEAAVMSGRLAAHAISRSPALEQIIGYDHP